MAKKCGSRRETELNPTAEAELAPQNKYCYFSGFLIASHKASGVNYVCTHPASSFDRAIFHPRLTPTVNFLEVMFLGLKKKNNIFISMEQNMVEIHITGTVQFDSFSRLRYPFLLK